MPSWVSWRSESSNASDYVQYDNSENCDLIIYTHFTRNQDFWNKNEKPYLLWNGERYSLPSRMRNSSNKLIVNSLDPNSNLRIPYAFFAYVEYKQRNLWLKYKNLDIANKRLFSYCISANRGSNIRNTFVETFSKKCNDIWCLGVSLFMVCTIFVQLAL